MLAGALATAARAQGPGPGTLPDLAGAQDVCPIANQATQTDTCDTEYAPVGKDGSSAGWTAIGGAEFNGNGRLVENSPTPYTVDFFTTAFRNPSRGFFAGAACKDPSTPFDRLDSCERVPAVYEYRLPPGLPPEIREVLGPSSSGEDGAGYVGQIAWISGAKAIAVGGTGVYPRREPPRKEGESDAEYAARDLRGEENAAGRARVWLYDGGQWRELGDLPRTQDGTPMAGLSTVDCSPRLLTDGEFCIAGGMRQLWLWKDGRFAQSFTPTSTDESGKLTVDDGAGWRFRVRSVKFWPGDSVDPRLPQAVAVTSGCCAATEAGSSPRLLLFGGKTWKSRLLVGDRALTAGNPTARSASPRTSLPDSYYSLFISSSGSLSVVATPATPERPGEPEATSRVIKIGLERDATTLLDVFFDLPFSAATLVLHAASEATTPRLSSARLLSADGDFDNPHFSSISGDSPTAPDGLVDWAVGVLPPSGQAIAYTTAGGRGTLTPNPLDCTTRTVNPECRPRDPNETAADTQSHSLYTLDSYALNAFAYVPGGGVAWAAGDRGAIQRLGGEGSLSSQTQEPAPERVGPPRLGQLPDDDPYDQRRPQGSAGPVGAVPSLSEQPEETLPEPALLPAGTPDPTRPEKFPDHDVRQIVMSRDGSEGWAIGAGAARETEGALFHYDGERWRLCETDGIPGQVAPDPACASLADLHRYINSSGTPVQLNAAARVPLERDRDPTNDDEFEIVAVGSKYQPPRESRERPVVLRYHEGRWSVDVEAMKQIDPNGSLQQVLRAVVFTSPDDGWIEASDGAQVKLYRYGGKEWINCSASSTNRARCDDPAPSVLPLDRQGSGPYFLTQAGSRVYFAGSSEPQPGTKFPFIFSLDAADPNATWRSEYDPGTDQGHISAFTVAVGTGGNPFGWAAGLFGRGQREDDASRRLGLGSKLALLRLDAQWQPYSTDDAAADYLFRFSSSAYPYRTPPQLLSLVGADGQEISVLAPPTGGTDAPHPMLSFAGEEGRWRVLPTPFPLTPRDSFRWMAVGAIVQAMAPDGQGGYWAVTRQADPNRGARARAIFFYHYTDRAPRRVFEDVAHPVREQITSVAPGPDGALWVTTNSGVVYRYDRLTGWDRVAIPGWDPGRVVTRVSAANAVAIGPDGSGVVVGEAGRIANVGPSGVQLDPAAGARAVCELAGSASPCGSGRDLIAAAVAPDGSAMVAGEARALLWRSPGGAFEAIPKPDTAVSATLTGVSMPTSSTAYVATDTGEVFHGSLEGGTWRWVRENENSDGDLITLDAGQNGVPLRAIAIDNTGDGYAVGERGLAIERTGDGTHPWKRLDSGVTEDLYSVALPQNGNGTGALIGGELGLILSRTGGRFEVARTDDATDPMTAARGTAATARIVGLALMPGLGDGEVEAWAASQVPGSGGGTRTPGPGALLHHTSSPEEPLLNPAARADPLSDTDEPGASELSFAALGRSDCHLDAPTRRCIEPQGTTLTNEVVTGRTIEAIAANSQRPGGPQFILFTGDANHAAGRDQGGDTPLDVDVMHRRWVELVADEFEEQGMPLFGALGVQDLSQANTCALFGRCTGTRELGVGNSEPWREAFSDMPAPWGSGPPAASDDLSFEPLAESGTEAPGGGAQTHYAADIQRDGRPIVRLVVADNSLRSLATSEANQNPIEEAGQATWLERVLCIRGSEDSCTRAPDQEAIVLANTPAYSPNPEASAGGTETAADAAAFEQLMLDNNVDVVVSGRLGWNGIYWTLFPGLHFPCPGGSAPNPDDPPPAGSAPACSEGPEGQELPDPSGAAGGGSDSGAPDALPTVVASGAGGTFGPVNDPVDGPASQGFWHGYSVVHLGTATGKVSVEQRPVFDWVGIQAKNHVVLPRQRVALQGFGREVAGADTPLRYDEIDSYAITHRYDLLAADPDEAWLPLADSELADPDAAGAAASDGCGPYVCLPSDVGTIGPVSGEVRAGQGNYPRTFALAMLSVGEHSATWPLVFESRPTFRAQAAPPEPPAPRVPAGPTLAPAPAASPPLPAPPPPPPPPASPPSVPQLPTLHFAQPPALPAIPPLAAEPPLSAPQPPAPALPPPPASQQSPALELFTAPEGISIAPQTSVFPPPPPPVQPAPPSGARREARQRQAAVQKTSVERTEEAESEGGVDPTEAQARVNPVDSPVQPASRREPSAGRELAATRRDRVAPDASITALANREQPSAWARGLLYGGGITLAALVLALGFATLRPRSRRREPELPAPAWAQANVASMRR